MSMLLQIAVVAAMVYLIVVCFCANMRNTYLLLKSDKDNKGDNVSGLRRMKLKDWLY